MRKANAAVVMATQSIADAMSSGIVETVIDSTATKILLPHPSVGSDQHRGFYANMLGPERARDRHARARHAQAPVLLPSEAGKRLFELNLSPKTLAFVGRSSIDDVRHLKGMTHDHPDDWRERWLDYCDAA